MLNALEVGDEAVAKDGGCKALRLPELRMQMHIFNWFPPRELIFWIAVVAPLQKFSSLSPTTFIDFRQFGSNVDPSR